MPREEQVVSRVYVKLKGAPLSSDLLRHLQEVVVDQHTHLPHMFMLRFNDRDLDILDGATFNLTDEVEIEAADEEGAKVKLITKGEVTAIEPEFGEGMIASYIVRGYDKSHRMYREVKSKAHLNKKDSDLAQEIGGQYGLSTQIEATSSVYDHIFQHNQSDMGFLVERAWRIGYECFVEEGKLYFRKPKVDSAAITLKWGEDLASFSPRMTLSEQVSEVTVKGWDPETMEAIVGQASQGKLYPKIGESKDGAAWGATFGVGKLVIVNQPVYTQGEAGSLAQARLNERSGAFVQAEGVAFRRPDLRAGKVVKLQNLGTRLSGDYLVTEARHSWTAEKGLYTFFAARGTRTGLLAEQALNQSPVERWNGLVTAVVTNLADPKKWGRVKLKYPWLDNTQESDWARVVSPGAGKEAGFFMVPAVNDEVLVGFEHGDFNRPYVLGGLWNGKQDVPPPGASSSNEDKEKVRVWHSHTGHYMAMFDDSNKKVEVKTAAGHIILMDDQNKKLEIKTSGGIVITLDDQGRKITMKSTGDVTVESQMNMTVKAGANMTLEATGNMDIKANGMVNVKGATVNLN